MPKAKAQTTRGKAKAGRSEKKKKGKGAPRFSLSAVALTDASTRTDPNAPKRGLSAYMFFANEQRENVREENPGIAFGTWSDFIHLSHLKANH